MFTDVEGAGGRVVHAKLLPFLPVIFCGYILVARLVVEMALTFCGMRR